MWTRCGSIITGCTWYPNCKSAVRSGISGSVACIERLGSLAHDGTFIATAHMDSISQPPLPAIAHEARIPSFQSQQDRHWRLSCPCHPTLASDSK